MSSVSCSALAQQLAARLAGSGLQLTTAESCTGGLVASALTSIPGSSVWFERGFVTYSNASKQEMLGVSADLLEQHGAVSEQTVMVMVQGAVQHSHAQLSLAISGIAGPGGGSVEKPVGTVCFAWCDPAGAVTTETCHFTGDRDAVREQAVCHALEGMLNRLGEHAVQ